MAILLDAVYVLVLLCISPYLAYKACTTGKYRRGLWSKLTGVLDPCDKPLPAHADFPQQTVWFQGVSVGEIHLLGPIVQRFRERHPDWLCAISATTDTGYDEAKKRLPGHPSLPLASRFFLGRKASAGNSAADLESCSPKAKCGPISRAGKPAGRRSPSSTDG